MQLNKATSAWHGPTSILKSSSLLSWQRGGGWRQSSAVKYSRRWQSETRTWPLNLASLFSSPARSILAASSARHSQGSWQSRGVPKPTCTCIPCKSAPSCSRNVNHVSVTLLSQSVWRKRNNLQWWHNNNDATTEEFSLPGPFPLTCMIWAMAAAAACSHTSCAHATSMHQVRVCMQPCNLRWQKHNRNTS